MIRSKINPSTVQDLTWKDYAKLFEKDLKQAQDKDVAKVPLIMVSDFKFACGEIHALLLLGKQAEMTKTFKKLKMDPERKKLKDFSIGFCHIDEEEDGSHSIRIAIEGFGKPNKMKKNSRKLLKKLGINLKDIIKGQYTDEVIQQMDKEATSMQQEDDQAGDNQKLRQVARNFTHSNKEMTTVVISLLKRSQTENVGYNQTHVDIAEKAFRAAASLVDKYEEELEKRRNLAKSAKKITGVYNGIVKRNLVKKYQAIWKKVQQEYNKQMKGLSEPFKAKLEEYRQLMKEIIAEEQGTN